MESRARYRMIARLGRGGMADVLLAASLGPAGFCKLVVLKKLREDHEGNEAFREMFLDEARLAARLHHPNVVQTYEVIEEDGDYVIAMEYLDGQPLSAIAKRATDEHLVVDDRLWVHVMCEVLAGLDYAHDLTDYDGTPLGIVHRDVSPQNVFVTYDGQVKVVDFGIARAEGSSSKTQAGVIKGKVAYMAPEQLVSDAIDRRVDVFTAGIVLWELLAGQRLMARGSTAQTLARVLRESVAPISSVREGIDPELESIVMKALARDPERRWPSAGAMREALGCWLDHEPPVRQGDLARWVSELFSQRRQETQSKIREQMARYSSAPPPPSGKAVDSVREDTGLKGSERFALTHAPSVAAPPPTLWPPAKWRLPLAALERRVELLAERTRTHRFVVGGVLAGILTVLFVAILLEGFGTHAPRSLPQVVVARGAPERSAARLLPPEALPLPSDRRGHEAAAQSELVRDADPVGASAGHPSPKTADPFLPFAPEHGAKGVESRRSPPAPRKAESSAPRAGPARAAALRPNRSPDDTRVNPEPRGGSAHASSNSPAPSATTSFEANSSDGASRPASGGAFAAPPAASSPAPPSAPEPPPVPTGRRVRTDF